MFQAPATMTSPAAAGAPPAVAWVSRRAIAPGRGLVLAPDGTMVTAEPTDRGGYHANLVRITPGASSESGVRVRSIGTRLSYDPLAIEGSGEGVFAITTGKGFHEFSPLLRIKSSGEAPGPTVIDDDSLDVASLFRFDHQRVGLVADRQRKQGHALQAAVLRADGIHWLSGPRKRSLLSSLFLFSPVGDEQGGLIDVGQNVEWRYPSEPETLVPAPAPVTPTTPGQPAPPEITISGYIGAAATGVGNVTAWAAQGYGRLKVQTYAKDGTPNTLGAGDALLAVVTPGEATRTVPVPIPDAYEAACAQGSLTDQHGVQLGQLWNGPDGGIWSVAGCLGPGGSSELNGYKPTPTLHWLVRFDRASFASSAMRFPADGRELSTGGGRGFAGPGGVMYIATPGGTLAVSGLQPAGALAPRVQRVRRVAGGRVRAEVRCVGTVGQACFGRVRFSDAGGTLGTLKYGVSAGTVAMDPVAVRELKPRRAVRGAVRAKLLL